MLYNVFFTSLKTIGICVLNCVIKTLMLKGNYGAHQSNLKPQYIKVDLISSVWLVDF